MIRWMFATTHDMEASVQGVVCRDKEGAQDSTWPSSRTAALLARFHEGHRPIRTAKRDCLVILDDEPCPRNQRAEAPIQVRQQRLRMTARIRCVTTASHDESGNASCLASMIR